MTQKNVVVKNPTGLHARPANVFVKTAVKFPCSLKIQVQGKEYNAKSIVSVLKACIKTNTEITIVGDGENEAAAVEALAAAVEAGLGE